jgi:hypothetical protein
MIADAEELASGAKFVPLTDEQLAKARSDYNAALQQVGG